MAKINYKKEATNFLEYIGGFENIESFLHCHTRMRYNIINKEKINIDKIKESNIVKGINWSGQQLQLVLGAGIVDKISTETEKLKGVSTGFEIHNQRSVLQQKNFLKRAMSVVGDIFLPIIPAIVAAGLLMGFRAFFVQLNVLATDGFGFKLFSILTDTAFGFLPVLVCWSTVKRFGGSPVLGIIIGLMLVSPLLPDKGAVARWEYFLNFTENGTNEELVQEWLERIGAIPSEVEPIRIGFLSITGYQGSVLPPVVLGIGAAYLEKGLRKIVPNTLNMILTPFATISVVFLSGLFILGPILMLIENGVLIGATFFLKDVPFGIGTGILAGILQVIVITGTHQLLQGLEMQMVIQGQIDGQGSIMNAVWTASIVSQAGAGLAVCIREINKSKSKIMMASVAPAFFGITEPVIFGVNLEKGKPFLMGLVGGFAGGLFAGIVGATTNGMGVTVIPGLLLYSGEGVIGILKILAVNVISFGIAFALTIIIYSNKLNIKKIIKSSLEKKEEKMNMKLLNEEFKTNKDSINELNKFLNNYKTSIIKVKNIEFQLKNLDVPTFDEKKYETLKLDDKVKYDTLRQKYELKLEKFKTKRKPILEKLELFKKASDEFKRQYDSKYKNKVDELLDQSYKTLSIEQKYDSEKLEINFK